MTTAADRRDFAAGRYGSRVARAGLFAIAVAALAAGCTALPGEPQPEKQSDSQTGQTSGEQPSATATTVPTVAATPPEAPAGPVAEAILCADPGVASLATTYGDGAAPVSASSLQRFLGDQVQIIADVRTLHDALLPDLADRVRENLDFTVGECTEPPETAQQRVVRVQATRQKLLGEGPFQKQAARLAERIEVAVVDRTTNIVVRLRDADDKAAADLVNCVVDSYMLEAKRLRNEREARRLAPLRRRLDDLMPRLTATDLALRQFNQQRPLLDTAVMGRRLEMLQKQRVDLQLQLLSATALKEQFDKGGGLTNEDEQLIQEDPTMANLRASEAALVADLANAEANRLSSKSDLEARLKIIRKAIAEQRMRLVAQIAASRKQEVEAACNAAKAGLGQLKAELDTAAKQAAEAEQLIAQREQLADELKQLQSARQAFQEAITRMQIALEIESPQISILRPAGPAAP